MVMRYAWEFKKGKRELPKPAPVLAGLCPAGGCASIRGVEKAL